MEVPIPMTQEEVVHVPKVITQTRVQQQHVEQTVEVPIPMTQEEVVHVPKVITQTRVQQQHVEQTVEVPVPMTQDIVDSQLMLVSRMLESISVCLCWLCFNL